MATYFVLIAERSEPRRWTENFVLPRMAYLECMCDGIYLCIYLFLSCVYILVSTRKITEDYTGEYMEDYTGEDMEDFVDST